VTNTVRRGVFVDEVGVAKAMVEDAQSDRTRVKSIRKRFSIIVVLM
jgi:hypothetical protein